MFQTAKTIEKTIKKQEITKAVQLLLKNYQIEKKPNI